MTVMLPFIIEAAAYFLAGAVAGGAASFAVTTAICYIAGKIDIKKIKEEMAKRCLKKVMIKCIDNTENQITLADLDSKNELKLSGDDISDEIYQSQIIYA